MTWHVRFPFKVLVGLIFEDGDSVPLEYRTPAQLPASMAEVAPVSEPVEPFVAINEDGAKTSSDT